MKFFHKAPEGLTHLANFNGFRCWIREDGDGLDVCGTNAANDWCILHVVPLCQWVREHVAAVILGVDYEPSPWAFKIIREIRDEERE